MPCFIRYSVQSLWRRQPQLDAACSKARATRFGLAALIPGLLVLGASCQSPSPSFFRELKIGFKLHLILTGSIFQEPEVGSYYAPFHGAFVTSVDHREKKPGSVARERSLYLETGQDQVLVYSLSSLRDWFLCWRSGSQDCVLGFSLSSLQDWFLG